MLTKKITYQGKNTRASKAKKHKGLCPRHLVSQREGDGVVGQSDGGQALPDLLQVERWIQVLLPPFKVKKIFYSSS